MDKLPIDTASHSQQPLLSVFQQSPSSFVYACGKHASHLTSLGMYGVLSADKPMWVIPSPPNNVLDFRTYDMGALCVAGDLHEIAKRVRTTMFSTSLGQYAANAEVLREKVGHVKDISLYNKWYPILHFLRTDSLQAADTGNRLSAVFSILDDKIAMTASKELVSQTIDRYEQAGVPSKVIGLWRDVLTRLTKGDDFFQTVSYYEKQIRPS